MTSVRIQACWVGLNLMINIWANKGLHFIEELQIKSSNWLTPYDVFVRKLEPSRVESYVVFYG